jgi:hypothetical protein
MLTSHSDHMRPPSPARSVWIFLVIFLVACWGMIIWLAVQVSTTTLAMIKYVVELAQLY